jgi:hypothetical protein
MSTRLGQILWVIDHTEYGFEIWHVEYNILYRAGSLMTVLKELYKYKSNLRGMQEVRWESGCPKPAGECTFFYGNRNDNGELGTGFFFCA